MLNHINNSLAKKIAVIAFCLIYIFVSLLPPKKVEANPLAVPAGIEAGVGAYVLGALAVAGAGYVFGQTDTADNVYNHAIGVWNSTQDSLKASWNATVNDIVTEQMTVDSSHSFKVPITPDMTEIFKKNKVSLINAAITDPTTINKPVTDLTYPVSNDLESIKKILLPISSNSLYVSQVRYYKVGLVITTSDGNKYELDHFDMDSTGIPTFYTVYGEDPTKTTFSGQRMNMTFVYKSKPQWMIDNIWSGTDTINNWRGYTGQALADYLSNQYLKELLQPFPQIGQNVRITQYDASNTKVKDSNMIITSMAYRGDYTGLYDKDIFADWT